MNESVLWVVVVVSGIGTFLLRWIFIGLSDRVVLPAEFGRALAFVPAAVLPAIILPALLRLPDGTLDFDLASPKIWAAVGAAAIAYFTRNTFATIVGGMCLLWLQHWLLY